MAEPLRSGLVATTPAAKLEGEVEVYVVAGRIGHKRACAPGQPAAVAKRNGSDGGAS
jgi:hypothetical protein